MNSLHHNSGEFSRLKTLLLREEQQVLSSIEDKVRHHDLRIGDDEALQRSVTNILTDALRDAEVRNHRELAAAIAPVIVGAIRREIRNASDEVVDAMYPIMGRLIRAYVASAIRDFVEETNRKIEGGLSARFIRLRIKSLVTGTPYRTLLIREGQALRVASIYLIDRSTGTLLGTWNADTSISETDTDEHLIGGMLTAINNFAAESLAERESELRALDLGEARVFLRASAAHLVAVKTVGKGDRAIKRFIDTAMQRALETITETRPDAAQRHRATLAELADSITTFLARHKQPPVLALSVFAGLFILAGLIAYQHHRESAAIEALKAQTRSVIGSQAALQAFPLSIDVAPDRSAVTVAGLVPTEADRERLIAAAQERLHPVRLDPQLVVVPPVQRYTDLAGAVAGMNAEISRLRQEAARQTAAQFAAAQERIAQLETQIARRSAELQGSLTGLEKQLGQKTANLNDRLAELYRITQDPLLKLSQWVSTHAIFFAEETTFRNPNLAIGTLADLKRLLDASDAKLRIIGYTDPTGSAETNDTLASLRAEKVANELEKLGVSGDRLKTLGRPRGVLLSYDKGPFSSNRRVEFEIAYIGEPTKPKGEPLSEDATRP